MTEKTITQPPAIALAQSMCRAQNSDSDSSTPFRDDKEKWVALARKTMRILENQGYTLSKTDG
ncbi:hypothetical protein [uncultured Shimia sp.]|uniref:hypothetical protein n=1 Tax=uncultured Shimia sp. TaxID=573152 RepID=UPI0025E879C9|nr:hypothetical protein [uncultured Shimia sp.]